MNEETLSLPSIQQSKFNNYGNDKRLIESAPIASVQSQLATVDIDKLIDNLNEHTITEEAEQFLQLLLNRYI